MPCALRNQKFHYSGIGWGLIRALILFTMLDLRPVTLILHSFLRHNLLLVAVVDQKNTRNCMTINSYS